MTLTRMHRPFPLMYALVAWAICGAAINPAQAASGEGPQRCAVIAEDAARLACYDSLFGKPATSSGAAAAAAGGATSPASATVSPAALPAAAASDPEADFGLTEAAKRARDSEQAKNPLPESISGTVAKVGRQPAGELIVTLEDGQVWTQVEVDVRARVAAGDTVTIKRAALGSYLLVTASRYATRVRRVK